MRSEGNTMRHSLLIRAAFCAVVLGAGTARAHHSFAVFFDTQKTVSVTGVVKEFRFTNPHGLIALVVPGKAGARDEWKVETNSPSILRRRGWTVDSLKVGDSVTIEGWPARDNSHYIRLRKATRANGQVVGKPFGAGD
jgi:hypothetical protein